VLHITVKIGRYNLGIQLSFYTYPLSAGTNALFYRL